ncbi:MAG TPA: VOC family protein [Candidatus Elarobacter sp.]|jgi:PhnB protein|nr:VOC family protein [Candidatus Elarobacter sp.]
MLQLEPYLNFLGNCEEALNFYARVFGGEVSSISRFGDAPPGQMELPPDWNDKVMHANLKAPGVNLMGSDRHPSHPDPGGPGRITLSLGGDDADEGKRVFDALAEGGTVTMPYQKTFWGANFGMLTDKYGIDWMINVMSPTT